MRYASPNAVRWEGTELLELAEASAGIGAWDVDLATGMVRARPQFFRLLGLDPVAERVPIEVVRALRHPDDRANVIEGFQQSLKNRTDYYESEYRIFKDGHVRWILGRGRVVRNDRGEAVRYSGVDIDITERKSVVPHLKAALQVGRRLAAVNRRAAGACAAVDDRPGAGVILVDRAARILFANRVADALISNNDGLSTGREGLWAVDSRAAHALRRLIASCAASNGIDSSGGVISVTRGKGRAPLHVIVVPLGSETSRAEINLLGLARAAAILIITDPEREREQHSRQLRKRFGLTEAEANLAQEIMRGDGRIAAAARLGISPGTARTHLERIFHKTGVHRQAELVNLLLGSK